MSRVGGNSGRGKRYGKRGGKRGGKFALRRARRREARVGLDGAKKVWWGDHKGELFSSMSDEWLDSMVSGELRMDSREYTDCVVEITRRFLSES